METNTETKTTQKSIYPVEYYIKSLGNQLESLKRYGLYYTSFGVGADEKLINKIRDREITLPVGAEGWFAVPSPLRFPSNYSHFLERDLAEALKASGFNKLYIYCEYQLKRDLKFHKDSMEKVSQIDAKQGHPDILIIPAQFGSFHPHQTAQLAREKFMDNEFGLGAFAVGAMLLTHYERIGSRYKNPLNLICPGDVLQNTHTPNWNYGYHGELNLDFYNTESHPGNNVSGFVY